ncbi:MAG: cyclic nucleotide-binding domain-containing protein [Armatimonadetes bacterium]|nr:cyclic nucleotide-binding domain-containing protein [Armatimonadota bacterium]
MPDSKEYLQFLKRVPLFTGLPEQDLERIAGTVKERQYAAGEEIVQQGRPGFSFFMILDGGVEVRRDGHVLRALEPGEFFGEIAVLDDAPRSATVVATRPTTCLAITRKDLVDILKAYPEIAVRMLGVLARRLREWEDRYLPG